MLRVAFQENFQALLKSTGNLLRTGTQKSLLYHITLSPGPAANPPRPILGAAQVGNLVSGMLRK